MSRRQISQKKADKKKNRQRRQIERRQRGQRGIRQRERSQHRILANWQHCIVITSVDKWWGYSGARWQVHVGNVSSPTSTTGASSVSTTQSVSSIPHQAAAQEIPRFLHRIWVLSRKQVLGNHQAGANFEALWSTSLPVLVGNNRVYMGWGC